MFTSHSFNAFLLASHILSAQGAVLHTRNSKLSSHLQHHDLTAFAEPAPNEKTDKYVALKRRQGITKSTAHLNHIRKSLNLQKRQDGESTPLIASGGGVEYLTQITFGQTNVDVIVDTGSSDTWLIESDFQCVNSNGASQAQSACNFGPTYPGTFGSSQIPNVNFNISYGDGEFVTGNFGTINITVAGITVPQQTVSSYRGC
jgi:aspergillopepsin I